MKSFISEIENPVVEKDILDFASRIARYQRGAYDEEKFRSLRLARGVYGQRQPGVQMVRIKIPYGKLTTAKFRKIADICDHYSTGKLHLTTRQDIQIHYVSLDHTPELWARLESEEVTLREACGNTVRNITASAKAGIDPNEPFDVTPYADAMFRYFLRNPICQQMGRKFKIAFSSSTSDSAFTLIHDIGLIPQLKDGNRGFKVLVGGGLGAVPRMAEVAYEFLPENELIPFAEALLRVFDRYGERQRRMKARLKFLLKELGLEALIQLVDEERKGLQQQEVQVSFDGFNGTPNEQRNPEETAIPAAAFDLWKETNVFAQKQAGFFGVFVRVPLGDLTTDTARKLALVVDRYAADDLRITINQGFMLRFVRERDLPAVYNRLRELDLALPGFDSIMDITACPGTDTCNLGISSSTGIARVLEQMLADEFPHLVREKNLKIKISGCPNSCGQHGIAGIGFHGSSMKVDGAVMPALQVLLGGEIASNGMGNAADKVIKIPSKRGPEAVRMLLHEYDRKRQQGESFAAFYHRLGKMHFYQLLKPLTDVASLDATAYIDWGQQETFQVKTETGECAGVLIDLVSVLLDETGEELDRAHEAVQERRWADASYHGYNVYLNTAKAMLLTRDVTTNTQMSILQLFEEHFPNEKISGNNFKAHVLQIKTTIPDEVFTTRYLENASTFFNSMKNIRQAEFAQKNN